MKAQCFPGEPSVHHCYYQYLVLLSLMPLEHPDQVVLTSLFKTVPDCLHALAFGLPTMCWELCYGFKQHHLSKTTSS